MVTLTSCLIITIALIGGGVNVYKLTTRRTARERNSALIAFTVFMACVFVGFLNLLLN